MKPDDMRGKAFISKVDYRDAIEELSRHDIEPINLEINSEFSDFGTTEYEDCGCSWDQSPYHFSIRLLKF
mgnify:CR=1 FL=1